MDIIRLDRLTRRYGRRRGVESVDLTVPEGSIFGFLGPNGAGKTTAIRVLAGLLRPTSGVARIFHLDCWKASRQIKREVGYLPGDLNFYPWITGREGLWIAGRVRGQDLTAEGERLARLFDLDLSVKVRRMSRGMRQKLGLILTLAHRPRLLILDEPSTGLDPLMQDCLHEQLRQLAAEGHTIFFSSHTLSEVEDLCDRVAIIRSGRLVANQLLADLRAQAGYQVYVRFAGPAHAPVEPPPFLRILRRSDDSWWGLIPGNAEQLVQWLAGKRISDLSIRRPDLETVFRQYYDVEDSAPLTR